MQYARFDLGNGSYFSVVSFYDHPPNTYETAIVDQTTFKVSNVTSGQSVDQVDNAMRILIK